MQRAGTPRAQIFFDLVQRTPAARVNSNLGMNQFAGGQRQGWTTDWSRRSSGGTGPLHELAEAFANPAQFVRGVDAAVRVAANGQARGGLQEDHGIMLPDVVKASWPLCSTKLRLLADRETLNTVWRAVVEALTSKIGPEFRSWCSTHFRYHDLEREIKIPVDSKHAGMFHTSDSVDLFGFVRYGTRLVVMPCLPTLMAFSCSLCFL